jgi:para-aminobenzoate synthetase/4-amino-4-deoxychorismate lyase
MTIYAGKTFINPEKTITAFSSSELLSAFKQIEAYKNNYFLIGYIRYEARFAFAGSDYTSKHPLLYFEAYTRYDDFIKPPAKDTYLEVKNTLTFNEYKQAIEAIKDEIKNGNTYEVNYTYNYNVHAEGGPFELYRSLLEKQTTPYNFYMCNEYDTVLSFSPELFFRLVSRSDGKRHIITKPMKGTIRRGKDSAEDAKLKQFLQDDIKNRAENVMIVDLLRNDLGRVAELGSVEVTRLFEVETHPTLHTMTSQVEADLKNETSLFDIFRAIFPCGSVTGAPKISTMNIIDRIEEGGRDIYCGAIGLIEKNGDCEFSVPIRMLQKKARADCYTYRVGGAIVWDSTAEDEWVETITKTKFIHGNFKLIETMKAENGIIHFQKEHHERIKKSALHFGFTYNDDILSIKGEKDGMLRFLLAKDGSSTIEYKPIREANNNCIRISPLSVQSSDEFLQHKTTYRPLYTVDYTTIYDEIFFNEKGELTEGSRTNIVLEIDEALWTPPLSSGLLNGIYRQYMLERGICGEKVLCKDDLLRADKIYCVNSVRGKNEVALIPEFRYNTKVGLQSRQI